jgi:hypothetical protein
MACLHLPDVEAAVRAADQQEILLRPPLDAHHGEDLSRGQHDTAPLLNQGAGQVSMSQVYIFGQKYIYLVPLHIYLPTKLTHSAVMHYFPLFCMYFHLTFSFSSLFSHFVYFSLRVSILPPPP